MVREQRSRRDSDDERVWVAVRRPRGFAMRTLVHPPCRALLLSVSLTPTPWYTQQLLRERERVSSPRDGSLGSDCSSDSGGSGPRALSTSRFYLPSPSLSLSLSLKRRRAGARSAKTTLGGRLLSLSPPARDSHLLLPRKLCCCCSSHEPPPPCRGVSRALLRYSARGSTWQRLPHYSPARSPPTLSTNDIRSPLSRYSSTLSLSLSLSRGTHTHTHSCNLRCWLMRCTHTHSYALDIYVQILLSSLTALVHTKRSARFLLPHTTYHH